MKNELNLRGSAEYEFSEALARAFCRKLVYLFFLFFAFHCFLAFVCLFFLCKSVPASFSKSFYHHCQCCRQSNIKIDGIKNHGKEKYPYVLNSFLYEPCKGPQPTKKKSYVSSRSLKPNHPKTMTRSNKLSNMKISGRVLALNLVHQNQSLKQNFFEEFLNSFNTYISIFPFF